MFLWHYINDLQKELTRSRASVILEILPPLVMLGFTCLVQSMPSTYLPLYFRQEFHISESTTAIVISATMFVLFTLTRSRPIIYIRIATYIATYIARFLHHIYTNAKMQTTHRFTYVISCLVSPVLDGYVDVNLVLITSYFLFLLSSIAFAFIDALPTNMVRTNKSLRP